MYSSQMQALPLHMHLYREQNRIITTTLTNICKIICTVVTVCIVTIAFGTSSGSTFWSHLKQSNIMRGTAEVWLHTWKRKLVQPGKGNWYNQEQEMEKQEMEMCWTCVSRISQCCSCIPYLRTSCTSAMRCSRAPHKLFYWLKYWRVRWWWLRQ